MNVLSNNMAIQKEILSPSLHGCSLLFDNPGQSFLSVGDLLFIDKETEANSVLPLYRVLYETVAPRENNHPLNQYMLNPKPAFYYHVTVWGGINDRNIEGVAEPQRTRLRNWLARLPDSLLDPDLHTNIILESPLVKRTRWNVRFRFDRIVNWHDACLAALLKPVDLEAEQVLREITQERAILSADFESNFSIKPPDEFIPHITLRRFANRDSAQKASAHIDALSNLVHQQIGHTPIIFDSISLYGFTQVTDVFKRKDERHGNFQKIQ